MKRFFRNLYFLKWFGEVRLLGKKKPLQSVIAVSNLCNLRCRHCCVVRPPEEAVTKSYEKIRGELEKCYRLGSRFVDFSGGEPFIWRDGDKTINDLFRLAREIGFFSTTVTTNAQIPFDPCESDLVWVSLDGVGKYHNFIRGEGAFERLEKNVRASSHPNVNANMVINRYNYEAVEETVQFIADHPKFRLLSVSFHTPFPGTEGMALDWEKRIAVLDKLLELRKKGAPIMNTSAGLRRLKDMRFPKKCWITNFVETDGQYYPQCRGNELGICEQCGFGMSAEMIGIYNLSPETVRAGLKVRM